MKKLKRKFFVLFLLIGILTLCVSASMADDDPFKGMLTYGEGQYKVGRDFIAGEYVLLNTSNYSGYFAITKDANGKDIYANDLFETNSIITVQDGEYLELSNCIAIDAVGFYGSYTIKTENNTGVMLKVGYGYGYDIQPGEYKVTAAKSGRSGYYCIYNNSRHKDIVANDLFSTSAYVEVRAGQYLILSNCYLNK